MASIPRAQRHPLPQTKPRPKKAPSRRQLDHLHRTLACDTTWSRWHLPLVRGVIDLLRQDGDVLEARMSALGLAGPTVLRERIALLDAETAHLGQLADLVRQARATLADLVQDDVSLPSAAGLGGQYQCRATAREIRLSVQVGP